METLSIPTERIPTNRLAVIAGLSAFACPLVGAVLGPMLGAVALMQIGSRKGRMAGAGMAWVGIVVGLAQIVVGVGAYQKIQEQLADAPASVAGFLDATCRGSLEGAPVASGLKPLLERGPTADSGHRLVEALGPFQKVGERREVQVRWNGGPVVEVEYALSFAKGAPANGRFTLVREYGAQRVQAFTITSPALKPPVSAAGAADTRELGWYGGQPAAKGLKDYKP